MTTNNTMTTDEYHDTLPDSLRPVFDCSVSGFVCPAERSLGVFPRSYKHCVQAIARERGVLLADEESQERAPTNGKVQTNVQANQGSLDLGETSETQSSDPTAIAEGETRWIGNWEARNHHGYYQSREGGKGPWKFHISGFDSSTTGQNGHCSLIMAGGGRQDVPIDAKDRITVLGVKYGRRNWTH